MHSLWYQVLSGLQDTPVSGSSTGTSLPLVAVSRQERCATSFKSRSHPKFLFFSQIKVDLAFICLSCLPLWRGCSCLRRLKIRLPTSSYSQNNALSWRHPCGGQARFFGPALGSQQGWTLEVRRQEDCVSNERYQHIWASGIQPVLHNSVSVQVRTAPFVRLCVSVCVYDWSMSLNIVLHGGQPGHCTASTLHLNYSNSGSKY